MPRARLAPVAAALAAALAGCGGTTVRGVPVVQEATSPARVTPAPSPPVPAAVVGRGDGRLVVVPGTSAPSGPGKRTTYVVEVEGGLGVEPGAFAAAVEDTLADPRSWGADGHRALQRVADVDAAALHVTLASPALTDRLCAPLDTGGYYSCANGARAVVNVARWLRGAPAYQGRLEDYRAYLVNHEVGHTLGFGHVGCPGAAQVAPVMLQQTKGLEGCAPGPWPYP